MNKLGMECLNDLLRGNTFVLFIAPPAFGKTRLLLSLFPYRKILFVSPLRALAEEFYKSLKGDFKILIMRKKNEREIFQNFLKKTKGILIITPELFQESYLGKLSQLEDSCLIVLDEFHLFYTWGTEFRPVLLEVMMGLASTHLPLLALSATIADIPTVERDFNLNFENSFLINLGNQTLKYPPSKTYWFLSKKLFNRRFIFELEKREGVSLYFCRYRQEVDQWMGFCKKKGIKALGCKGGEVFQFIENLQEAEDLQCIFATTVLSHGVNLPAIRKVFISYKVEDKSFWVQMTGRGGRAGQPFQLYHFDDFLGSKKGYFRSLLMDIVIRLKNLKFWKSIKAK